MQLSDNTVTVAAFDDVLGAEARTAGLKIGDEIVQIDTTTIDCTEDVRRALEGCDGDAELIVRRGNRRCTVTVPTRQSDSGPRLGVYLRQGIAGIGTITFYDPDTRRFGALGHGVSGLDGTQLLMLQSGYLVRASVAEVRTGTRGTPGELHGIFDVTDAVGTVEKNTACGIFGTLSQPKPGEAVQTAPASAVTTGAAEILSNVDGEQVQRFSIRIDRVDPDAKNGRNLLITVTDEALLAKTGGIVQGMSGSPILQNGKLVGAVTHVLVNDPTMGYGVLIENMLEMAK